MTDPAPRRRAILVVDDVPANLDVLTGILSAEYQVRVATGGEKALALAAAEPPDLVLLDVMMPGLDGYEVCRRLKAQEATRHIPVIFVTALGEPEDESHGFAVGGVDYAVKPVNAMLLRARVRAHLALADQREHLAQLVRERTQELEDTRLQVIRRLGRAAEYVEDESGDHVVRISHYARLLGRAAGMSEREAELLYNAAPMHDVGKIGIPDAILRKPGPLDAEEWAIVKRHPAIGAAIIGQHASELLDLARTVALTHHERWDGSGYPRGLKGEAIPLAGRIVAIADVFDSITGTRAYKAPQSVDDAMAYVQRESGRHFDPKLVALFTGLRPQIEAVRREHSETGATPVTPMA